MDRPMEIDKGVYIKPSEVASIEDQEYWNNSSPSDSFLESSGCRIILQNGQKIYLKHLSAIDAHDLLFPPVKDIVPSPNSPRAIVCNVNRLTAKQAGVVK